VKILFERTENAALVREILTHPKIWPWIASDGYPPPEEFWPAAENPAVHYLLVRSAGEVFGLYITHPINAALWEVDHALLPTAWGAPSYWIGRAFEEWLWANTSAETALGLTPADNALALKYARRHGMTETGRIPKGIKRGGKSYDLVVFTKHRPHAD
jgi:hypothetical protein